MLFRLIPFIAGVIIVIVTFPLVFELIFAFIAIPFLIKFIPMVVKEVKRLQREQKEKQNK